MIIHLIATKNGGPIMGYMNAINKWLDNLDKEPEKPTCIPGKDCNSCSLAQNTPENRFLYVILSTAEEKFGDAFYLHVENICPNLTCCPVCRMDDFTHVEGCWLDTYIQRVNRKEESK